MDLSSATDRDLFTELQRRFDHGVCAVCLPDSDANQYLWWGSRVYNLGLTSRLDHSINVELEDMEEGEDESGSIEDEAEAGLDALVKEFPQVGQYL